MKYLSIIDETARALAFLTRLPVPARFFKNFQPDHANQTAGFYPLAGIVIGAIAGTTLVAAHALGLTAWISATIAILTMIAVTGALHEDGLADIADGFGGGKNIERRLEIMKDSTLGTYGVIALIGSIVLRIAALAAITASYGAFAGLFVLIAASAVSRAAMVWMWNELPNVRADGVAAKIGKPAENAVSIAAITGLGVLVIFGIISVGFLAMSMAIGLGLLSLIAVQKLCKKMIGGQTGDTLGACQQVVEIAVLVGLAMQVLPLT